MQSSKCKNSQYLTNITQSDKSNKQGIRYLLHYTALNQMSNKFNCLLSRFNLPHFRNTQTADKKLKQNRLKNSGLSTATDLRNSLESNQAEG